MKVLFLLLGVLLLCGCGKTIEYKLCNKTIVPENKVEEANKYTVDLVNASNGHHVAGKSRNKGEILRAAAWQSLSRFGKDTVVFKVRILDHPSGAYFPWSEISKQDCSSNELRIYEDLLDKPLGWVIEVKAPQP